MSEAEPSSSYPWAEDPLWLCMVTLFVASLATLILYFVQYFQLRSDGTEQRLSTGNAANEEEEAASLLGWALSLQSWKSKWKGSWCRALNAESKRRGVSLMTNTRSSRFLPQVAVDSRNAVVVVVEGRQLNETSTLVMF